MSASTLAVMFKIGDHVRVIKTGAMGVIDQIPAVGWNTVLFPGTDPNIHADAELELCVAPESAQPDEYAGFYAVAMQVAGLGVPAFPITPGQKAPACIKGFQELATTDEPILRQWGKSWPNANAGALARPDGVLFLDEDQSERIRALYKERTGKDWPRTWTTESRPGHRQSYWLQTDRTRKLGNKVQRDFIDGMLSFRQRNEYVLAAGSIHPDTKKPYELIDDSPIIPMPDDLVDFIESLLIEKRTNVAAPTGDANTAKPGDVGDKHGRTQVGWTLHGAPIFDPKLGDHDGRNDDLSAYAYKIYVTEMRPADEVRELVAEYNQANFDPPLDDKEVETLLHYKLQKQQTGTGVILNDKVIPFPRTGDVSEFVREASIEKNTREQIRAILDNALSQLQADDPSQSRSPRAVATVAIADLRKLESAGPDFPKSLTDKSLWGIPGEFVATALPFTEASPEMLLFTVLPMLGIICGSGDFARFGSDYHTPSLFSLIVSATGTGKGQAQGAARAFVKLVDENWYRGGLKTSTASGEALIRMVSEAPGKRLALVCGEMKALFDSMSRDGSNLSANLRNAYDGIPLQNNRAKKANSEDVFDYMLGVLGSITPGELTRVMPAIDWANGLINRFIWTIGRKSKTIALSPRSPDFRPLADRVKSVLTMPRGEVQWTPEAQKTWTDWVYSLPTYDNERLAESQERIRPNALRVALLYAKLDERRSDLFGESVFLEPRHIEAAIEIVSHSRDSVRWFLDRPMQLKGDRNAEWELIVKLRAEMNKRRELTPSDLHNMSNQLHHMTRDEKEELMARAGFKKREKAVGDKTRTQEVWTW